MSGDIGPGDATAILADLNRAKVLFQRRALLAALQIPTATFPCVAKEGGDTSPVVALNPSDDRSL